MTTAFAYFQRARIYLTLAQTPAALRDLDQSIALNRDFLDAYQARALIYNAAQNYDQALPDYDRIVELDPQNFNSYYQRGSFMKRPANIQRLSTILHRRSSWLQTKHPCWSLAGQLIFI